MTHHPSLLSLLAMTLVLHSAAHARNSQSPEGAFHETVPFVITEADPMLEGHGPCKSIQYSPDSGGTLLVWASHALDPYIRVADHSGRVLSEDDSSGGGTVAFLHVSIEANDILSITLAVREPCTGGDLDLHVISCPETRETRQAAEAATAQLDEIDKLLERGERGPSRRALVDLSQNLLQVPGGERSFGVFVALKGVGSSLCRLGDLPTANLVLERLRVFAEQALPDSHPDMLSTRANLAIVKKQLGHLQDALELEEKAIVVLDAILPAEHPDLLRARANLATTLYSMGHLERARELQEVVLGIRLRELPDDHPSVQDIRGNLAQTLKALGYFHRARLLEQKELEARLRTQSDDHLDLQIVRLNLGSTLYALGELQGARELQERALGILSRTLPPGHPYIQSARGSVALTRMQFGDFVGARELLENVIEDCSRILPPDHPLVLNTMGNLANTLGALGDVDRAHELLIEMLEGLSRALPADHPSVHMARMNLALTTRKLGNLDESLEMLEDLVEARCRTLPVDHPWVLQAKRNLAGTLYLLGDVPSAHERQEEVFEVLLRALPADDPELLAARISLAMTRFELGDAAGARELLPAQLLGMLKRLGHCLALSPREAGVLLASEADRIAGVLSLSELGAPDARELASLFELVETRRYVATAALSASVAGADSPEIERLQVECARLGRLMGDKVSGGPSDQQEGEEWRQEIVRVAWERDEVQRRLREALLERRVCVQRIDPTTLQPLLQGNTAVVGFATYGRRSFDEDTHRPYGYSDSVLALVLRPEGPVRRIDLGTVENLETRIRAWRSALGKPIEGPALVAGAAEDIEGRAGLAVRRALLDRVLEAAGLPEEGATLHVCLDDFLHLVPLDALPLDGGGRLGDKYRIRQEVSFARLIAPRPKSEAESGLLAMGDVDFGAEPTTADPRLTSTSAPVDLASRAGTWGNWDHLPGTRGEVEALRILFEESLGEEADVLTRGRATKSALAEAVAGKRYIHLATHGWFAPEAVRSLADVPPQDPLGFRLDETVRGFTPLSLCGLCLAGANHGRDERGRVPGLLTAEELAWLDLSDCELAVLSGCDTNVGIHRAGQGIQSLQTALHAAGARTAITSLWKVPDDQTKELMLIFYKNLWQGGVGKAEALWEAKRKMRERGYPVGAWAGWVLTGDPD